MSQKETLPINSNQIDSKAFEILVREHHRQIMAYSLSLVKNSAVAEDLVQDSFITAFHKLSSFDSSRDFSAWIRGIVRNKYREWARSRREKPMEDDILDALDDEYQRWQSQSNEKIDAIKALRDCLKKLPKLIHEVVDCFYFQQLSGQKTAQHYDISESVVRKRLQRGRIQLSTCIQKSLEEQHV